MALIERERDKYLRSSLRRHQRKLDPAFNRFARQLRRAFRIGGLEALNRAYNQNLQKVVDVQKAVIEQSLPGAGKASGEALLRTIRHTYGKTKLGPALQKQQANIPIIRAQTAPERIALAITKGAPETVVQQITTLPDRFGYTYSDRIWRNHHKTRAAMNRSLQKYLRDGEEARSFADELRRFQMNDRNLPRHMQRLERAGRAALAGDPRAKSAFLREIGKARTYAKKLAPGPEGSRGFQKKTIASIERAVKEGNASSIDNAIDFFVEKRGKRQAYVLLQSETNRAYQETSLQNYQENRFVQLVQWKRSPRHKHYDECDLRAETDVGLGPGVYYKDNVPWPAHPLCNCVLLPIVEPFDTLGDREPPKPFDKQGYDELVERIQGPLGKYANRVGRRSEGMPKEKVLQIFKNMVPETYPPLPAEPIVPIMEPVPPPPAPTVVEPTSIKTTKQYREYELRNFGEDPRAALNVREFDALESYKSSDYVDMNGYLRDPEGFGASRFTKEQVQSIRDVFNRRQFTVKETTTTYRGMTFKIGEEGQFAPLFEKKKSDVLGSLISDKAFTSIAGNKDVATKFIRTGPRYPNRGLLLEITVPEGSSVIPVDYIASGTPGKGFETEFLLPEKAQLRITDIRHSKRTNITTVKAELIP